MTAKEKLITVGQEPTVLIVGFMPLNFVALDFETANFARASACSLALVRVEDGIIVDEFYSLIKPLVHPEDFTFTYVHGIKASDVINAPTWQETWQVSKAFIGDVPMVGHNVVFDRGVLNSSLKESGEDPSTVGNDFYCTFRLAKKFINGLNNYQLSTLAAYYNIPLVHHNALSDARASALLMAQFMTGWKFNDFLELQRGMGVRPYTIMPGVKSGVSAGPAEIITPNLDSYSPSSTLAPGANIVFTGAPKGTHNRQRYVALATALGLKVTSGVNAKTNILVVGEWYEGSLKDHKISSKLAKAIKMKAGGNPIAIMTYEDFDRISGE